LSTLIITHTDLDGVASAAIYLRLHGGELGKDVSIVFTEPYKLHKTLSNTSRRLQRIAIMDLGPNADTFGEITDQLKRLISNGVRVEWYDHHRWRNEWVKELSDLGVHVYVDTSTCAAGVVAKYAPDELESQTDDFIEVLVRATCAADLWKWDDPWAPKLYRIVGRHGGPKGDRWKRVLVKGFAEGAIWWPDLDEALQEYLNKELNGFNKALRNTEVVEIHGCKIVFVLKDPGPPNASILGNSLLYRFQGDIAVIVRKKGTGISLRSIKANVQKVAYELGGGGHPRAAGAPLKLSLPKRLLSIFWPKVRLHEAKKQVLSAVERLGGCSALLD
jgi:oligoribonuclease NrnB/cAMP/cGMP phosphodiesterase (DHH superfamily)